MNTNNPKMKWVKRVTGLMTAVVLTLGMSGTASARILFEDDDFFNINSEGFILDYNNDVGTNDADISLQFGNDGTDASIDYNGSTGDVTLSTPGGDFNFSDDNLTGTGGLDFDGNINFAGASEFHIREVADEAAATCTTVDEIVLDTTENRLYICTATGSPGTWVDAGDGADLQSVYDTDASGAHEILLQAGGAEALEIRANANGDDLFQLQNSSATNLINFQDLGGTTIDIDSLIVDWDATGAFNLDATGALGIDSASTVTIGGAGIGITSDGGALALTGDGTNDIDISNAGAAIDLDSATFDLLTTGAFSIDGTGASNVTTDTGNLALSATTSGDVDITGATNVDVAATAGDITLYAGDDVIFDDAQLVGIVQLSDTATDWNATFASDGIVDNINSLASTANGEGASNVGIEDASGWFTGAEIEAALNEIETLFGSTSSSAFDFTEDNVLADNDAVYSALNKLDLKWGDLASTAGAALVGVTDTGDYFTGTDVEAVLQELGASNNTNFTDLTFYPEYPDSVIHADGSDNRGTLESFYDGTEKTGYYNWTSANATTQDIDIRFSFPMPTDFSATGDFTFRYRTGSATEADNDVEITLYNITDSAACAADTTNVNAGAWATGTITAASINTGCTGATALGAGDIVEVQIKLLDNEGAGDYADVGKLIWNYTK